MVCAGLYKVRMVTCEMSESDVWDDVLVIHMGSLPKEKQLWKHHLLSVVLIFWFGRYWDPKLPWFWIEVRVRIVWEGHTVR